MIEQDATVVALDNDAAWVETARRSACGACAMNKGCGAGMLARAFGFATPTLKVMRVEGIEVGDQVVLGIDERALVRGSFAAYMVPILFMLGFAVVGESLAARIADTSSDLLTMLCGVSGLAVGLLWLQRHTRSIVQDPRYQPVIVARLDGDRSASCVNSAVR